jgi:alpha-glucosidase (family GH31 glycosyl hydrolase)
MLDKNSNWDNTNGLKTLINTALTFGILGYPFILPDMIGGNAYSGMKPDRELFIASRQINISWSRILF